MTQQELVKKLIQRDLPVKLSEAELAAIAREIGRLDADKHQMEGQAKVSADQWKDRIRGVDAKIADLATKAHEGQELRATDCTEEYDYQLGEVRVVRCDTGEKLEVRPMTGPERQPTLPGPGMEETPKKGRGKKAQAAAAANDGGDGDAVDPDAPPGEG